jgi:hypothetical protein
MAAGGSVSETDGTTRHGATQQHGATQPNRATQPHDATQPRGATQLTAWAGAAAIAVSVLVMVLVSAGGPNVSVPAVHGAASPPWWQSLHLSATVTVLSLWLAMALGCAGVIAALVAVARGARLPVRVLLGFGFLAVVLLTVLPPAGSTDSLSYAANGRMAVLGHSPYVMTPLQLKDLGDPIGRQAVQAIPGLWDSTVSVYGPVATAAEWVAAKLGGTSLAHITFWLKLLEAICFGAVALVLDRVLRRDPAMRLRAHLLWTVNPLLLWEIVAAGHIDGLSAIFGLLAIVVLRPEALRKDAGQKDAGQENTARDGIWVVGAFISGVMVALAAGVKVEYALLGLAVAWACRRSIRSLAAAAAGFAVITVPAYLIAGTPAIKVLVTRSPGITWDTMYQLFWRPVLGYTSFNVNHVPPHLEQVAYVLFAAIAILAMLRIPDHTPEFPALAPALGLSLAWLFVTAFQRPWYDVMAISLLALYSASLIDWMVLFRLLAGASVYVIAVASPVEPHWLYDLGQFNGTWLTPVIRLLATVALVWLCISGRWGWQSSYPQGPVVDNAPDNVPGHRLPLAT